MADGVNQLGISIVLKIKAHRIKGISVMYIKCILNLPKVGFEISNFIAKLIDEIYAATN